MKHCRWGFKEETGEHEQEAEGVGAANGSSGGWDY